MGAAPRPADGARRERRLLPGRVNFAVRGRGKGDDVRARLRVALPDATGEIGNGHARATDGSLNPEEFGRLVAALGVPAGPGAGRPG